MVYIVIVYYLINIYDICNYVLLHNKDNVYILMSIINFFINTLIFLKTFVEKNICLLTSRDFMSLYNKIIVYKKIINFKIVQLRQSQHLKQ